MKALWGLHNDYYQDEPETRINTEKDTLRSTYRKDTLEFTVIFSRWKRPEIFLWLVNSTSGEADH